MSFNISIYRRGEIYREDLTLVVISYKIYETSLALVTILIFSTHSMKYIWYSPQTSKYRLYMPWIDFLLSSFKLFNDVL